MNVAAVVRVTSVLGLLLAAAFVLVGRAGPSREPAPPAPAAAPPVEPDPEGETGGGAGVAMVLDPEVRPKFAQDRLHRGQVPCRTCLVDWGWPVCGRNCPEEDALVELRVTAEAVIAPFSGLSATLAHRARFVRPPPLDFTVPGW